MNFEFYNKKGLCGLKNLGNTCYINSITHCMNNNHNFIDYLLTDTYKEDLNKDCDIHLLEEFIELSKKLYSENSIIHPGSYMRIIKNTAEQDACYKELLGYGQADSQEFLQFFLEKIHEQLKYEVEMEITGVIKNDTDRLAVMKSNTEKTHFKNSYSKIVKEFYGMEYSKIFSSTLDDYKSETMAPFSMLTLEIPSLPTGQNKLNLYDCLDNYTSIEKNIKHKKNEADTNTYNKQIQFWSLPNTFIIVIKRYDNFLNKKNNMIDFPIKDLNMYKYCVGYDNDKYVYDLFAISNHSGGIQGGHYWAYCKNTDGNWYNFNDEDVSLINESKLISPQAYCLFYKKK